MQKKLKHSDYHFVLREETISLTVKVSEATVEIMDTPYLHGIYSLTGYGVPCIDRISLEGFGLNSKLVCQGNIRDPSRLRLYFICNYIFY